MTTKAGRPPFQPTEQDRKTVEQLAAFGVPFADMPALILDAKGKPIGERTLRRHFAKELSQGAMKANAKVAQSLFRKALDGDTASMIFWLKTRARWRETPHQVEVTGKDGGAIEQKTAVVDERQIKAALERFGEEY